MTSIDHIALNFSSRAYAERIFTSCLGMKELRSFTIGPDLAMAFFDLDTSLEILVYGDEGRLVEAFLFPGDTKVPPPTHVCLKVDDIDQVLMRAEDLGFRIRKAWVTDHHVYFVEDDDGNLYELK